jgi:hydroxypyruvate isomerase
VKNIKDDVMKNSNSKKKLNRRQFVKASALAALALAVNPSKGISNTIPPNPKFKLKYAPHFGMFEHHAGDDLIDQLKFMADQGFTALEDNGMMGRSKSTQEKIATEMARLDMAMGVFVALAEFEERTFVRKDNDVRAKLIDQIKQAVVVASRVNAKWCTVVPGAFDTGLEWDYQTANVIENLKWCADVCETSELVMVLEPLNAWRNHPGLFLTKVPQAYMGDNPGRNEPTTGEINYRNVFKHIYDKGYKGALGMEHGNSVDGKEGEQAVIDAYRFCDNF